MYSIFNICSKKTLRKRAKEAIEKYYFQLTEGCGRFNCSNSHCASNQSFVRLQAHQAAQKAVQLAREKAELCEFSCKAAKQFKPCTSIQAGEGGNTAAESELGKVTCDNQDEDMEKEQSDDEDVVFNRSRYLMT